MGQREVRIETKKEEEEEEQEFVTPTAMWGTGGKVSQEGLGNSSEDRREWKRLRGWGTRLNGRPSVIEIGDEEDPPKIQPTISPTEFHEPAGPGEMFGRYWKSAEGTYEFSRRLQEEGEAPEGTRGDKQTGEEDSQWMWSPSLLDRLERQAEKRNGKEACKMSL